MPSHERQHTASRGFRWLTPWTALATAGGQLAELYAALAEPGREQLLVLLVLQRTYYVMLYLLLGLILPAFIFALLVWQSPGSQMLVRSIP